MPFESSWPLVVVCLLGAVITFILWLRTRTRGLLAAAALCGLAGGGAIVADALVETDREHLRALFPRLAVAAERQQVATIMAALDPDLRPLRNEVERALTQVRPAAVVVTRIEVTLAPESEPPEAVADLIVRVTGNVIDDGTPGTVLAGLRVLLRKKGGRWLVQDAEIEQARPGRRREPHRPPARQRPLSR